MLALVGLVTEIQRCQWLISVKLEDGFHAAIERSMLHAQGHVTRLSIKTFTWLGQTR